MSCSEYRFRPETVDELFPREYVNAVHLSCARFVADENSVSECAFVANRGKALDVVLCRGASGLGFDCDAAVHDEIDLVAGSCAPVGDFGIAPDCIGVGDEFVENPAFESVAVFGGAGRKRPAPLETAGDARVEEVELRRLDGLAREAFSPNRHFACEKGVLEDLEVLLNRGAWDLRVGGDGLIVDLFAACERGDFERNNSFRRAA